MTGYRKIDPEAKTAWVAALRSGEYDQSRNSLFNGFGYCCLGVACAIGLVGEGKFSGGEFVQGTSYVTPGGIRYEGRQKQGSILGLDDLSRARLIRMNDGIDDDPRRSFAEIADWIEENL